MWGLQHCFALERTITRKQFFIDHRGTTLNKTNKLDNQAISTLKENLEDLTLIKYRLRRDSEVCLNASMPQKTPNYRMLFSSSPA